MTSGRCSRFWKGWRLSPRLDVRCEMAKLNTMIQSINARCTAFLLQRYAQTKHTYTYCTELPPASRKANVSLQQTLTGLLATSKKRPRILEIGRHVVGNVAAEIPVCALCETPITLHHTMHVWSQWEKTPGQAAGKLREGKVRSQRSSPTRMEEVRTDLGGASCGPTLHASKSDPWAGASADHRPGWEEPSSDHESVAKSALARPEFNVERRKYRMDLGTIGEDFQRASWQKLEFAQIFWGPLMNISSHVDVHIDCNAC